MGGRRRGRAVDATGAGEREGLGQRFLGSRGSYAGAKLTSSSECSARESAERVAGGKEEGRNDADVLLLQHLSPSPQLPTLSLKLSEKYPRMASLLQDVQERLQDPSIPWQAVVLAIGVGVGAFEGWIG